MKKVAIFGVKTVPFTGGIENVVENTVPYFDSTKFSTVIYVRKKYFTESDSLLNTKLVVIPHLNGKSTEALSHTFLSCLHALFIEKCDIYFFHAIVLGSLTFLPKLFFKKVILQTHGLDWKREKWGWFAKSFIKFSTWISTKFADKIACVGKSDLRFFKEKYDKKYDLIPNGINIQNEIKLDKKFISMGLNDKKYILYMSRLVPEKGPHLLANAYKNVNFMLKNNIKLVFAGDTNYYDDYYHSLKSEESDEIKFVGFVNGQLKQSLLSNALVFVQPSSIEGMSISVLEAMSFGLTTIVSDIPENTDVVGNLGITFMKNSSDSLTIKLEHFLKNQEMYLSKKLEIINYTKQMYCWEESVKMLNSLLSSIL